MKKSLIDILVCPMCKEDLLLEIATEDSEEVIEGYLSCRTCKERFPIRDSIPNLLPPELRD